LSTSATTHRARLPCWFCHTPVLYGALPSFPTRRSSDLVNPGHVELGIAQGGQHRHHVAVGGRRRGTRLLVGRLSRGHEEHPLQLELTPRPFGRHQVSVVNRIESAPHDADAPGAHALLHPAVPSPRGRRGPGSSAFAGPSWDRHSAFPGPSPDRLPSFPSSLGTRAPARRPPRRPKAACARPPAPRTCPSSGPRAPWDPGRAASGC